MLSFIKFLPSEYVIRYKKGKIVKEGAGLSFRYFAPNTSVVVVPISSTDVPYIFTENTNDYQTVTVQGEITYRIVDYKKIAGILDYTLDMKTKKYISDDYQKLSQRLINITKVLTKKHVENMKIREAIKSSESLARSVSSELKNSEEIKSLGIEIMGLSVLAVSPNKETARALEAEAREQILNKADEAIYERRNASIAQERVIKENELNTEVAIEEKKKQIKETELNTQLAVEEKRKQIKEEELNTQIAIEEKKKQIKEKELETKTIIMKKENKIKCEKLEYDIALEEKRKELIKIESENLKAKADAKAYELNVTMKAFEGIDINVVKSLSNMGMNPDKLISVAFQELAEKADKIGQLNIAPDLLQDLLKGSAN